MPGETGRSLIVAGTLIDGGGLFGAPFLEPAATRASESARMAAASSAALIAPERPMASVPTGMPAGIWTIE